MLGRTFIRTIHKAHKVSTSEKWKKLCQAKRIVGSIQLIRESGNHGRSEGVRGRKGRQSGVCGSKGIISVSHGKKNKILGERKKTKVVLQLLIS